MELGFVYIMVSLALRTQMGIQGYKAYCSISYKGVQSFGSLESFWSALGDKSLEREAM
jgi:hypothetical protein